MLQQTFFLLLNVFLSPLLSLSLSFFIYFFSGGERPRLNPRLMSNFKSRGFKLKEVYIIVPSIPGLGAFMVSCF